MKDLITISKRELKLTFRRTGDVLELVIMPLFMILFGSILMFLAAQASVELQTNYKADGYVVNAPDIYRDGLLEIGIVSAEQSEIEGIKKAISKGDTDILLVFPEDFEIRTDSEELCDIEMWYNSSKTESASAYQYAMGVLDSARPNVFTVNSDENTKYDLLRDGDTFAMLMEMLFPMYSLMGVLMAVASVAAYTVASDKERGFMNMLLITPVKRTHLAYGRAFALFIICTISAVSVLVGTLCSALVYPLIGLGGTVDFNALTYIELFVCILSAAMAMTGISFFASSASKSTKQASTPCSIVGFVIPIASMATIIPSVKDFIEVSGIVPYLIPMFNMSFCLSDVIASSVSVTNLLVAVGINLLLAIVMTVLGANKFNSEKAMQI